MDCSGAAERVWCPYPSLATHEGLGLEPRGRIVSPRLVLPDSVLPPDRRRG